MIIRKALPEIDHETFITQMMKIKLKRSRIAEIEESYTV